jgi:hypothetical protein
LIPEAKGKTTKDLMNEGFKFPSTYDEQSIDILKYMPLDKSPIPEELLTAQPLNYFVQNNIVIPASREAPASSSDKLHWYFPTKQAVLIQSVLADLNHKNLNKRI